MVEFQLAACVGILTGVYASVRKFAVAEIL